MSLKTLTKISALALIAGLTVGCASTADVQRAQNDASEAKAMARQALDGANSANACCQDNSEKFNRVFKKSMYK